MGSIFAFDPQNLEANKTARQQFVRMWIENNNRAHLAPPPPPPPAGVVASGGAGPIALRPKLTIPPPPYQPVDISPTLMDSFGGVGGVPDLSRALVPVSGRPYDPYSPAYDTNFRGGYGVRTNTKINAHDEFMEFLRKESENPGRRASGPGMGGGADPTTSSSSGGEGDPNIDPTDNNRQKEEDKQEPTYLTEHSIRYIMVVVIYFLSVYVFGWERSAFGMGVLFVLISRDLRFGFSLAVVWLASPFPFVLIGLFGGYVVCEVVFMPFACMWDVILDSPTLRLTPFIAEMIDLSMISINVVAKKAHRCVIRINEFNKSRT
jgi:hypothetical protein